MRDGEEDLEKIGMWDERRTVDLWQLRENLRADPRIARGPRRRLAFLAAVSTDQTEAGKRVAGCLHRRMRTARSSNEDAAGSGTGNSTMNPCD